MSGCANTIRMPERRHQEHPERVPLGEVQVLERIVPDVRDHQEGEHVRGARQREQPRAAEVRLVEEQDGGRHHPGGARDREPDEVAPVGDAGQDVEPRQAEGPADHVEEGRPGAHAARAAGAPTSRAGGPGATPNDTTSASESNSTPNWVVVRVRRATFPSSMSSTIPMKSASAAHWCRPSKVSTIA